MSIYSFNFSTITGPNKWNPKLYLSILNTVAMMWNRDYEPIQNKKEIL